MNQASFIDVGIAFSVSPAPTFDGAFFAINLGMTMSDYPTDSAICAGCRLETAGSIDETILWSVTISAQCRGIYCHSRTP
jgi:hypothetical protein